MTVVARARTSSLVSDWVELTKPRLTSLAVLTTMASFYLGSQEGVNLSLLAATIAGTAMMGGGGAALNQVMEVEVDERMRRTRGRPLPDGRVARRDALFFGLALSGASVLYLGAAVNPLTGLLAALALASYLLAYTPLKRRSPLCTVVGAVPGALPAMMGWTAARNVIGLEGWVLFCILFLWQIPHFLSIAWLYRDDYARAGLPMLPVVEPDGDSTSRQILIWTIALIPVSVAPTLLGMTGPHYFWVATLMGLAFLYSGVRMATQRNPRSARALLLASVAYLPLLQVAMLVDKM